MWARSLGWEGSLEKEVATHSSILARKSHGQRGAWWGTVHGLTESDTTEQLNNNNIGREAWIIQNSTYLLGKVFLEYRMFV